MIDEIIQKQLDGILGDRSENHEKKNDSLINALTVSREQELHSHSIEQEAAKTVGLKLKNQQAELSIEVEKQRAVAEGLSVNIQDPKPNPAGAAGMQGPKFPSSGELIKETLTNNGGNMSKGLIDAVTERMNAVKASGLRPVTSKAAENDEWLRNELISTLKKVDSEKHLSMGPLGQQGSIIGGLLDIISGPLDIGTEIFGGKLPAAQKAELISRAISQTSPLLRAEMDDLLARDKMEESASRFLGRRGLHTTRNLLHSEADIEGAEFIANASIEIRKTLAENASTANSFGTDATTGIGDAFTQFEEIHKLLYDLENASSEEEVFTISQKMMEVDRNMREPIRQYLQNGGTPEGLHAEIVAATDTINAKFNQSIQHIPGDAQATQFKIRQRLTALDFTNKLADFESAVLQNIPLDQEIVRERKIGKAAYSEIESLKDVDIKVMDFSSGKVKDASMKKDDLAVLMSSAKAKPGRDGGNNRIRKILEKYKMLPSEEAKLQQMLIGVADKEQHSAINKVFSELKTKRAEANKSTDGLMRSGGR